MTAAPPVCSSSSRPVFEVALESSALDVEVRINDTPVLLLPSGHVETKFDVNPHVISGTNRLSAFLRPALPHQPYNPGAQLKLTVRTLAQPGGEVVEEHATLAFHASELDSGQLFFSSSSAGGGKASGSADGYEVQGSIEFDLRTPFTRWDWLDSDVLAPGVFEPVYAETKRLWDLAAAKDLGALEVLAAAQAADWMQAYYLKDVDEAQTMLGIRQMLGDPHIMLNPLPPAEARSLQLVGFGRLAHLLDAHRRPPISFSVRSFARTRR